MSKDIKVKSPLLAAILSAVIPGLGQLYNGHTIRGLLYILIAVFSWFLFFIIIGYVIYIPLWILAVVTAYTGAKGVNKRFRVQQARPEKLD